MKFKEKLLVKNRIKRVKSKYNNKETIVYGII